MPIMMRPQNGLSPGAMPAVAGGGESVRPNVAPPTPGNIVGGYGARMNQAPAVAGMGETPRMDVGGSPPANTRG